VRFQPAGAALCAQEILSGDMEITIAGGTEMMSHQPIGSDWPTSWPLDFPYRWCTRA